MSWLQILCIFGFPYLSFFSFFFFLFENVPFSMTLLHGMLLVEDLEKLGICQFLTYLKLLWTEYGMSFSFCNKGGFWIYFICDSEMWE